MKNLLKRFLKLLRVFNISLSNSFADVLAAKLLEEYAQNPLALSDVLILLPNRRACKTMTETFVKLRGMQPMLLPQMLPIADVEEDELALSGQGAVAGVLEIPPAISPMERMILFMRIILSKPQEFGTESISLSQACFLAQELGSLIDAVHNENLDFANLQNLVPEEYAGHWQETLKFLEIITAYWPQILQERGVIDASERKNKLMLKQAQIWAETKPNKRIIIAGTTATFPSMRELVRVVAELPNGEIVLAGLDKFLDEESWNKIDESHPQFELKTLLDFLEISREQVQDLILSQNEEREKLLSEIMRPAVSTDKWRDLTPKTISAKACEGLQLIDCQDIRKEAVAIALIMREVLEKPEKTAALVTPDRNLARRVAAELERWGIKIDDSAGRPLVLTPWGSFMRLVAEAAKPDAARVEILSLLKHPLCGMGQESSFVRKKARTLEKIVWRGEQEDTEAEQILLSLQSLLKPLSDLYLQAKVNLFALLEAHIKVAEAVAATNQKEGKENLWRGDAGQAGAALMAQVMEKADVLGEVAPDQYLGLFEALALQVPVRPKYGTHPRLKVLGPIEARLQHFDVMILGEVNEGIWPSSPAADPWMSRPMKRDFGFPQPEKAIGVLGADLAQFMGAKQVYLTRAERVEGTPMLKSRWWMRLETVLKALQIDIETLEAKIFEQTAKNLDEPLEFDKISSPEPRPPLKARPRELSASGVEMLMRDPYSIFAKYILRLKKLEDIERELTMADFGNLLHGILEDFNNRYPNSFPAGGKEELLALGRQKFEQDPKLAEKKAFWWPKFEKMIEHLATLEEKYRPQIAKVYNEVRGRFELDLPGGIFTLTAKADRVDQTKDGKINIIDYKTGKARGVKEVTLGFAPQLPLEGIIAQKGGFEGIAAADVESLRYWQLSRKEVVISDKIEKILAETEQRLRDLITLFDFETTAYICQPNPKKIPEYSDYEHLARVKEWYVNEGGDD